MTAFLDNINPYFIISIISEMARPAVLDSMEVYRKVLFIYVFEI